jgi:hypothetical protein
MPKRVSRGLRFDEKRVAEIAKAARDGGFASSSAFIRAAVERELKGQESNLDETELRVTASLDRVARELRGVRLGHQAALNPMPPDDLPGRPEVPGGLLRYCSRAA